jgi:hypothetical protein
MNCVSASISLSCLMLEQAFIRQSLAILLYKMLFIALMSFVGIFVMNTSTKTNNYVL